MSDTNGSDGGQRLVVYAVGDFTDKSGAQRSRWTKVGVAFENRDGSITLRLHAFPIGTDKLQVREARDEDWAGRRNGSAAASEARP
ncbi:MAG TPA: hypothetical protein VLS93_09020 [Anaeromyxobacteraceae bacterium]|nr:hypothetical protein [Anaeromyxobacteraceae bacterium]